MRLLLRSLVAAVLALGLLAVPASATGRHAGHSPFFAPAPISAEQYLARAATSDRFEIVTGQLAQERAQSDAVKALGAEFVAHHTMTLEQGAAVAAQLGITPPTELPPRLQALVDRLAQLSGKRFDRVWIAVQIVAHQQALALHLRGAIAGEPQAIRTLAQSALPIVAQHYGQLIDLARSYGWRAGERGRHGHGGWDRWVRWGR